MDDVSRRLVDLQRDAWIPVVEQGGAGPTVSKLFGAPFLSAPWPVCQSCAEPMLFLLQLKVSDLPSLPAGWLHGPEFELHREHAILQLFNCPERECVLRNGDPYSGSSVTAFSHTWSASHATAIRPGRPAVVPEQVVVGWRQVEDFPCRETLYELEVEATEPERARVQRSHHDTTKFLGWPTGTSSAEIPCCHLCGSRMVFLFQLWELPTGYEHVTGCIYVCPHHPNGAFCLRCE